VKFSTITKREREGERRRRGERELTGASPHIKTKIDFCDIARPSQQQLSSG